MTTIHLADRKYTIINTNGSLTALRYGQPWRHCVGDGLMLALVQRVEELEAERVLFGELARAAANLYERADSYSFGSFDFNDDDENRRVLKAVDEQLSLFDHLLEEK